MCFLIIIKSLIWYWSQISNIQFNLIWLIPFLICKYLVTIISSNFLKSISIFCSFCLSFIKGSFKKNCELHSFLIVHLYLYIYFLYFLYVQLNYLLLNIGRIVMPKICLIIVLINKSLIDWLINHSPRVLVHTTVLQSELKRSFAVKKKR